MRAIKIAKFTEEIDEFEWIIEGLLPNVGWTLFYGLRGVGKTTFAMQLCASIQDGKPFLGRKTKQRNIMFIQSDSHPIEWKMMLQRIAPKSEGFTVVDVPAKALGNNEYVQRIAHYVEQLNPGFIVWDSLYTLSGSSINTEAVLQSVNIMKDISGHDIPFLLIHHPPHGESRAAGHSSLGASCSQEWCLLKTRLKIEKGRIIGDAEVLRDKAIKLTRDEHGLWVTRNDSEDNGPLDDPFLNAMA